MMDLTEQQLHEALDALTHDGDVHDITGPDGGTYRVRLRVMPDVDTHINDYDCYGRASDAHRYVDGGRNTERPQWATGAARKIEVDRGLWVWWQPAEDMTSAKRWGGNPDEYDEAFRLHVDLVTDLLRSGFHVIVLDLYETLTDSLGHDHDVRIASYAVGGIDSLDPVFVRDIISDGLAELEAPWDEPNPAEGR